jgi:hypothetical protein
MKTRYVRFFAEPDQVSGIRRRIDSEVLPRFSALPEFRGFVALQSEERRSEFVAMSFWDSGLESSEAISEEFRNEIERVTGTTPAHREFTVVRLIVRGPNGEVHLDYP